MSAFPHLEAFSHRVKFYGGALLILLVGGLLATLPERAAREHLREGFEQFDPTALEASAGTGVALGTLGGFRTVIADIAWLRAFHFWEKREPTSCLKFAELAITLAPEQYFFLENTANYVAFDFPIWEIGRRGGTKRVPVAVQREVQKKAMADGLKLLDAAAAKYPENEKILLLAAQVVAFKTEFIFGICDAARAASYYRRACELPSTPLFAFAAYARLVSEGVPAERAAAIEFLKKCLASAETLSRRRFFEELLGEYFPESVPAVLRGSAVKYDFNFPSAVPAGAE